jgi:hypothetical protein
VADAVDVGDQGSAARRRLRIASSIRTKDCSVTSWTSPSVRWLGRHARGDVVFLIAVPLQDDAVLPAPVAPAGFQLRVERILRLVHDRA